MKCHPTRSATREPSADARVTDGTGSFTGPHRRETTAPRSSSPEVSPSPGAVRAGHEVIAGGETAGVSVSVRGSSRGDSKGSKTRERPRVERKFPKLEEDRAPDPGRCRSTSGLTIGEFV